MPRATFPTEEAEEPRSQSDPAQVSPPKTERQVKLDELLEETRILLPGTEVLLGFLVTLPFTERFGAMEHTQRVVYMSTFFAVMLALVCFMLPAAYHRIARPIHERRRFKQFANHFLVAGLAPLSIGIVLVSWLVTSVVMPQIAAVCAGIVAVTLGVAWWAVPLARVHTKAKRTA